MELEKKNHLRKPIPGLYNLERLENNINRTEVIENNRKKEINNQEEIELAEALEKINEMERRQQNNQRVPINRNNTNVYDIYPRNNFGINFHDEDIIDVDPFDNNPCKNYQ
jgi:hypothetical protein